MYVKCHSFNQTSVQFRGSNILRRKKLKTNLNLFFVFFMVMTNCFFCEWKWMMFKIETFGNESETIFHFLLKLSTPSAQRKREIEGEAESGNCDSRTQQCIASWTALFLNHTPKNNWFLMMKLNRRSLFSNDWNTCSPCGGSEKCAAHWRSTQSVGQSTANVLFDFHRFSVQ